MVRSLAVAFTAVALACAWAPSASADAECHAVVHGSQGIAWCHNPDPDVDHVQLHIECRRWWDPDVDARPVPVGPAETVTLTDRCWKEIQSVWVTHLVR